MKIENCKRVSTVLIFIIQFAIFNYANSQTPDNLFNPSPTDTSDKIIGDVTIIGNKITKDRIITRELTFKKGDTITYSDYEHLKIRSEQNIFNTSLFNSVHINWVTTPEGFTNIFIIVKERWYIFPAPIFEIIERNINVWLKESPEERRSRIVYGGSLSWFNFRGRNETVSLEFRTGYVQRFNFGYSIPYITKKQNSGLKFYFSYSRNHQTNYATYFNVPVFYRDTVNFSIRGVAGSVEYTYRKGLYNTHFANAGYIFSETEDSVQKLNPDFFAGHKTNERYFILRYLYKSEHRDYIYYPLKGYEYDFEVVKNGFSFLNDDIDYAYISFNYRKFWPLSKASANSELKFAVDDTTQLNHKSQITNRKSFWQRWYFSAGLRGKISDGNFQPYFNIRALGYGRDVVRGYEYYITDGQSFGLLKTNLKFELLPKKEFHAKFIPLEKFAYIPFSFYINFYADAAYVYDKQFSNTNTLTNSLLIGYGAGIDFVTYYDIVLRFEYSINKFGESGFFMHFTTSI